MTLESNIKLNENVFIQEVDDEIILLDTKTEEYFSLNEVGGIFYNTFKNEPNLALALKLLEEEFDVSYEELKRDFFAFIKALEEKGLVTLT